DPTPEGRHHAVDRPRELEEAGHFRRAVRCDPYKSLPIQDIENDRATAGPAKRPPSEHLSAVLSMYSVTHRFSRRFSRSRERPTRFSDGGEHTCSTTRERGAASRRR